jgi:hypothetical protein
MFFEQSFVILNDDATEFDVPPYISNLVFKTPNGSSIGVLISPLGDSNRLGCIL